MQRRFKNKDKTSTQLCQSTNLQPLQFRGGKKKEEEGCELIKPIKINMEDLRSSWDQGGNFGNWSDQKEEEDGKQEQGEEEGNEKAYKNHKSTKSGLLADQYRLSLDVNP